MGLLSRDDDIFELAKVLKDPFGTAFTLLKEILCTGARIARENFDSYSVERDIRQLLVHC